jgi:outer membrane receptor protein involved in Fe transport
MTVARPHFREIAPALYFDYARRRATGGNPNLEETEIQNADLRWETYLGPTEILAASVFYKHFDKPIERILIEASSGQNVNFANADSADAYGAELEARASLGRIHRALSAFTLSGNLALIESEVDEAPMEGSTMPGRHRSQQGQSPYVANVSLGYEREKSGTTADILYNVYGRRIEEVGTSDSSTVYEEPVHRLDVTVSQKLSSDLKLKLSGTNLLNQRLVQTQNDVEILAYRLGIGVLATLELSVE